jgi:lysyl-tRNA synthetase class 2
MCSCGLADGPSAQLDSRLNRFVATAESKCLEARCGGMTWSTVIRGAWYLPQRRQLDLLFSSGRRYVYSGVPMAVANGFAEAESKGRHFNAHIRDRYRFRELRDDEEFKATQS